MKWLNRLLGALPLVGALILYWVKGQRDRAREQREALKDTLRAREKQRNRREVLDKKVQEVRNEAHENEVMQAERRGRGDRGESFGDRRLHDRQR